MTYFPFALLGLREKSGRHRTITPNATAPLVLGARSLATSSTSSELLVVPSHEALLSLFSASCCQAGLFLFLFPFLARVYDKILTHIR